MDARSNWLRTITGLHAFVTVIGVAIAVDDIESIIGSGPVLLLIGGILTALATRNRDVLSSLLGLSAFAPSMLVVGLINMVSYSPVTGYRPLLAVLGTYACLAIPLAIWLIAFRQPIRFPADV